MGKATDEAVAALVAKFENGDVPDGVDFSNLITLIQSAVQEHEHVPTGGAESGTGDAAEVASTYTRIHWVPASAYWVTLAGAGKGTIGVTGCEVPFWALTDGFDAGVGTAVFLPTNVVEDLEAYVLFCMDTATTGNVRLDVSATPVMAGQLLTKAKESAGATTAVPATAKTLKARAAYEIAVEGQVGVFLRHNVMRDHDHAGDTATGDLFFLGTLFVWKEKVLDDQ